MHRLLQMALYWLGLGLCLVGCSEIPTGNIPETPVKAPEAVKAPSLMEVARSQVGVLEDPLNSNRGSKVDAYNLTCGSDMLGAPWCASGTRWCFYQIGRKDIPGAYSPDWYDKKKKIETDQVKIGDQGLVYFHSLGRFAHTIACVETIKYRGAKVVEVGTIEFNSNPDGGREGYGVFRRIRSADSLTFVRWN